MAKLNEESHLERLELQWDRTRDANMKDMLLRKDGGVLEDLEPHPNLQMLCTEGYSLEELEMED